MTYYPENNPGYNPGNVPQNMPQGNYRPDPQGYAQGYAQGNNQGYNQGYNQGPQQNVPQNQDPYGTQSAPPPPTSIPISTALKIHGFEIVQELGIVYGIVARSLGIGKSFTAGFKSMAGGEIKQYTQLVEDSRRHALDRMIDNARIMGANAIISMRFDSSEIVQGITEVIAYGTAVVVVPEGQLNK